MVGWSAPPQSPHVLSSAWQSLHRSKCIWRLPSPVGHPPAFFGVRWLTLTTSSCSCWVNPGNIFATSSLLAGIPFDLRYFGAFFLCAFSIFFFSFLVTGVRKTLQGGSGKSLPWQQPEALRAFAFSTSAPRDEALAVRLELSAAGGFPSEVSLRPYQSSKVTAVPLACLGLAPQQAHWL